MTKPHPTRLPVSESSPSSPQAYTQYQHQCRGTTQKGLRCKKKVAGGSGHEFCHYHIDQNNIKRPPPAPKTSSPRPHSTGHLHTSTAKPVSEVGRSSHATKPGFIYVYTLTSLMAMEQGKNKPNASWLKVRNIPNTATKNKDKWLPFDHKTHSYTLIKVGMTTQTVLKRIKQWEQQCQHNLTCLYPSAHDSLGSHRPSGRLGSFDSPSSSLSPSSSPVSSSPSSSHGLKSLMSKFKSLRLNSSSSSSLENQQPRYPSLRAHDMGFYVPHSIMQAETQIHRILRKKYGSGDVLCTACKKNEDIVKETERASKLMSLFKSHKSKHESFQQGTFNIHVEWFLIPKSDIEFVYKVIDSVCSQYY